MPAPVATFSVGPLTVELMDASILALGPLDAIVSSDDNYLTHSGGVSAAIWGAAGPELTAHVRAERPRLRLGEVYVTPGFRAPAPHVLHAVTIDFDANRRVDPSGVVALYVNVLAAADRRGFRSLGVPLLGAGLARLGAGRSADGLVGALTGAGRLTSLRRIVVAAQGSRVEETRRRLAVVKDQPGFDDLVARAVDKLHPDDRGLLTRAVEQLRAGGGSAQVEAAFFDQCLRVLRAHTVRLGGAAAPGPEPSPDEVLAGAREALARAGHPPPPALLAIASDAIRARHRAAYDDPLEPDAESELEGKLARGSTALLELVGGPKERPTLGPLSQAVLTAAFPVVGVTASVGAWGRVARGAAQLAGVVAQHVRKDNLPPREPSAERRATSSRVAPRAVEPVRADTRDGTSHVYALRDLLLEHLDQRELDDRLKLLRRNGHVGRDDLVILEYCLQADPQVVLTEHFTRARLRDLVGDRLDRGADPDELDHRELATELLHLLGFPRAAEPRGLHSVRKELESLRSLVPNLDLTGLGGNVTRAATQVELVALTLLRFVCRVAFQKPAEVLFAPEVERDLEKASLGTLLSLLERLSSRLEEGTDEARAFERDFKTRRLAPRGVQELATLRNRFAHLRSEPSVDRARADAQAFYGRATELLDWLDQPGQRVYPHVIVVEQIRIDRWGRRTVVARDDQRHEEHLFTRQAVEPGETYLMHPLSNPIRVDPILVPAGELAHRR